MREVSIVSTAHAAPPAGPISVNTKRWWGIAGTLAITVSGAIWLGTHPAASPDRTHGVMLACAIAGILGVLLLWAAHQAWRRLATDSAEAVRRCAVITQDAAARQAAHRALDDALGHALDARARDRAHTRARFDALPLVALLVDAEGHCHTANACWESVTGRSATSCHGAEWLTAIVAADRPVAEKALGLAAPTEDAVGTHLVRLHDQRRGARWYQMAISSRSVPAPADAVGTRRMVTFSDVDRQVTASLRDRLVADVLSLVAESGDPELVLDQLAALLVSPHGIVSWVDWAEPDGTLRRRALAHAETPAARAMASSLRAWSVRPASSHPVARTFRNEQARTIRPADRDDWAALWTTDDAAALVDRVTIAPIACAARRFGVLGLARREEPGHPNDDAWLTDLGQRVAMLAAQRDAVATAQAAHRTAMLAQRAHYEFLAMISHELRTPLNAIAGFVQILMAGVRGQVSPAQREDLDRIRVNQQRLLGTIDNLILHAQIDAPALPTALAGPAFEAQVPLGPIFTVVEHTMAPLLEAKRLNFVLQRLPEDAVVSGDPDAITQIMMQLYANAIKFTKPGGVIVVAATAQEATVSITVRDTGIGINPDQCERIFEAFVRVEQVPVRGPRVSGGTGLGLALSRALARRMGGDVTVESTVGAGSTFTVTLPRGMAAPADDPPPRPGVHGGDTSRRPR